MIKHRDSHIDHGLSEAQLHYLLDRFADRDSFFIETFTLPPELGTAPCGLYGPIMGDPPIGEDEIEYAPRGSREWNSRLMRKLPPRQQHEVTVIAGPHEETCRACNGGGRVGGCGAGLWGTLPCPDGCHDGKIKIPCVLYTAFGGPVAPQEPDDPGCKDPAASAAFWRKHALAK